MPDARVDGMEIGVPPIHWSELVDAQSVVYPGQISLRSGDRGGRSVGFVAMGAGFVSSRPESLATFAFSAEMEDTSADRLRGRLA